MKTSQKFIKFTSMLDAWKYIRQNGLRVKPKRVSLYEWNVAVK